MGFELELFILLIAHILGTSIFGKFETETAWWRLSLKWFIVIGLTYVLYQFIDHLAIIFVLLCTLGGIIFHFIWCRKHNIDPVSATPRKKYYELRGWTYKED
ncbi:hypothetical protein [Pseudogracilibacillus sp. SO30301A]|uniref:hypothetical protein n=1 Tax=Pseudogracilibacillus sp. SO30301A TaxID=3098291 RepID=UPI00300E47D7